MSKTVAFQRPELLGVVPLSDEEYTHKGLGCGGCGGCGGCVGQSNLKLCGPGCPGVTEAHLLLCILQLFALHLFYFSQK